MTDFTAKRFACHDLAANRSLICARRRVAKCAKSLPTWLLACAIPLCSGPRP